ncbi:type IV toxin-antitoxin system AbiEi family antitoxin, partial [Armatimonas sp.]|uniref:type IV toxin-antitoxin system AbiEi family antitoxin n=1 Tax=Armatimonas sp. TaxID=1872638 RepID=UPI00286BA0DF
MNISIESLVAELAALPGVQVERAQDVDLLQVCVAGVSVLLRVVERANGFPRDVQAAVLPRRAQLAPEEILFVAAPSLTAASRQWLQAEGVGYFDLNGHLFVHAKGIYILREQMAAKAQPSRSSEPDIFQGKTACVLHALLQSPNQAWHVTELAQEAKVAAGTALKVCETLEKMLWMERSGRGPLSTRKLTAPDALLDAWAAKHRLKDYDIQRYYRWSGSLEELALALGESLEQKGIPYAATLTLGALHRAPHLSELSELAFLLPAQADLTALVAEHKLQPAEEGANVLFLRTKTDGAFLYRQHCEELWVASDVQLYLDLWASPGRGKEQAAHLRRERLA